MMDSVQRKKVMIVDDSEIVLEVSRYALESAGYDVVTHPRPAGCIAFILQQAPDLLLIDVNMPGLNGDTLVKMLGATQTNMDMIVLLHSSLADEVLAQKAALSRAHGYIRKSESPLNLVRQVARWMRPGSHSGTHDVKSHVRDATQHASDSRLANATEAMPSGSAVKILLVDHEMVELSQMRRLLISQPGPVEFALSGSEVLRRLKSESPPDIVVLGKLAGAPNRNQVVTEAIRLHPRWRSRLIVVRDEANEPRLEGQHIAQVKRPVTEIALRGAIQSCLKCAS
jgi:CheY-like chemotaxis protein